jgi:ABC-type transport system substrate-binding protein
MKNFLFITIAIYGSFMPGPSQASPSSLLKPNAGIIPSTGFVTTSFPRDVTEFGKFNEQVAIGQVLETLISADANGEISPLLATSWEVTNGGKTIRFHLRAHLKFSNGSPLTAHDVVSSISRHWHDERSQSFGFLQDIKEIVADDPLTITIKLKAPRVAIMKVFTRDQLGILPHGWTFNSAKSEPYIGSGPYRLIKENGEWYYVKNSHFRDQSLAKIERWHLLRSDDSEAAISSGLVPDVTTAAIDRAKDLIVSSSNPPHAYTPHDQLSFLQSSIWWHPDGRHYNDRQYQHFFMGIMRDLVDLRRAKTKWTKATGVIPIGVSGYLPDPVVFPPTNRPSSFNHGATVEVKIAIFKNLKSTFFADDDFHVIERKYNIKFSIVEFTESDYGQKLANQKPDIAIHWWYGGFNDPEGFLLLLPKLLNSNFTSYLGDLQGIYSAATVEQDWSKRAELFRTFNKMLVEQERMVPTWRIPTYTVVSRNFELTAKIFRYTPRLTDIVPSHNSTTPKGPIP